MEFLRSRPFYGGPCELVAVGQCQCCLERTAYLDNPWSVIAPSRYHACVLRVSGDHPVILAGECLLKLRHDDVRVKAL